MKKIDSKYSDRECSATRAPCTEMDYMQKELWCKGWKEEQSKGDESLCLCVYCVQPYLCWMEETRDTTRAPPANSYSESTSYTSCTKCLWARKLIHRRILIQSLCSEDYSISKGGTCIISFRAEKCWNGENINVIDPGGGNECGRHGSRE